MKATEKQIDYILRPWNKVNGGSARFLEQTTLPISWRQARGGLTKGEASAIIDELLAELKEKEKEEDN